MKAGQTNLLTAWEEKEEHFSTGTVVRIAVGGDRHQTAILSAVADRYNVLAERPKPTVEELEALVGQKVTLVETGENMFGGGLLVAQEGKLLSGSYGFGILPKGARTKGFKVQSERVLDVFPGYATEEAVQLVGKVRRHFPQVSELTYDRLKELPTNSETLGLCMFGSYRMPDSTQTDALYLASEYWPEDDIVEGVVLLRPEHGTSEHGSAYGRQFVQGNFGEVIGYEPISFAEGLHLCNLDFEEAYDQIIGKLVAA
ncbi:MAG TPA: hypothetical protein VLA89_02840 [Gemmatimonadales bacterium]|nr:hypothetical protein [Gemmatimonadales bacterium]